MIPCVFALQWLGSAKAPEGEALQPRTLKYSYVLLASVAQPLLAVRQPKQAGPALSLPKGVPVLLFWARRGVPGRRGDAGRRPRLPG